MTSRQGLTFDFDFQGRIPITMGFLYSFDIVTSFVKVRPKAMLCNVCQGKLNECQRACTRFHIFIVAKTQDYNIVVSDLAKFVHYTEANPIFFFSDWDKFFCKEEL